MGKLIDEFRKGWQGVGPPSLGLSLAFAVACLLVATLARWALAHVRPDVYFTPYFPAVFFAAAFGGFRPTRPVQVRRSNDSGRRNPTLTKGS